MIIQTGEEILKLEPETEPNIVTEMIWLAQARLERHGLSHEIRDLQTAHEICRNVLSQRKYSFSQLANILDINATIQAVQLATGRYIESTDGTVLSRASNDNPTLDNFQFGNQLASMFLYNGNIEFANMGIEAMHRFMATEKCQDKEEENRRRCKLAWWLLTRFHTTGDGRDLTLAMQLTQQEATGRHCGSNLVIKAACFRARYDHEGDPADLDRAIEMLRGWPDENFQDLKIQLADFSPNEAITKNKRATLMSLFKYSNRFWTNYQVRRLSGLIVSLASE